MSIVGKKLVDQIRTTGLKSTVAQRIDHSVTRFTGGMSLSDMRGILRGDAPTRPNPRARVHTEGFWFHIRPTFYHEAVTSLYPTFRLGLLSALFFTIEIVTGIYLMIFYSPTPEHAYSSMIDIITNVPFGAFVRDLHRLGAEVMVILVTLHMVRTFTTGSYKKPRQFTWFTGVVLLVVTLALSFSGYLLPWDQLSFWAVTIGTSMADAAPVIGSVVNLVLRGAPEIGASGLLRFYLLHIVLLPLVGIIFLAVHYYKVVRWGISLPPEREPVGEDNARKIPPEKRVPFLPDIATNELMYMAIAVALLALSCVTWYTAPLEHHADPLFTPLHTVAPWYFYWLQGLLKIPHILPFVPPQIANTVDRFAFNTIGLTPKILWGIVVGPFVFVLLFALPYIDPNPSRRYGHRKVMLSLGALFAVTILYLSLAGVPTGVPLTGFGYVGGTPVLEVGQKFLPDEGEGPLMTIPFDQLIPGEYAVSPGTQVSNAPELKKVLDSIYSDMQYRMKNADPLGDRLASDAAAQVTISDVQPNLRQVTLVINYTDTTGTAQTFTKYKFIDRYAGH